MPNKPPIEQNIPTRHRTHRHAAPCPAGQNARHLPPSPLRHPSDKRVQHSADVNAPTHNTRRPGPSKKPPRDIGPPCPATIRHAGQTAHRTKRPDTTPLRHPSRNPPPARRTNHASPAGQTPAQPLCPAVMIRRPIVRPDTRHSPLPCQQHRPGTRPRRQESPKTMPLTNRLNVPRRLDQRADPLPRCPFRHPRHSAPSQVSPTPTGPTALLRDGFRYGRIRQQADQAPGDWFSPAV